VLAGMALACPPSGAPNGCDLVKLLAATGTSCLLVRVWRGGQPYFCRPQVVGALTSTTDKRVRAAVAKAQAEEEEVQLGLGCSFVCALLQAHSAALTRMGTQPNAVVDASAGDLAYFKACKLVGSKTNLQSCVQVRRSVALLHRVLRGHLLTCPSSPVPRGRLCTAVERPLHCRGAAAAWRTAGRHRLRGAARRRRAGRQRRRRTRRAAAQPAVQQCGADAPPAAKHASPGR